MMFPRTRRALALDSGLGGGAEDEFERTVGQMTNSVIGKFPKLDTAAKNLVHGFVGAIDSLQYEIENLQRRAEELRELRNKLTNNLTTVDPSNLYTALSAYRKHADFDDPGDEANFSSLTQKVDRYAKELEDATEAYMDAGGDYDLFAEELADNIEHYFSKWSER